MRDVFYREDGVAGAVGAIFAMLIFVMVLSIYVTSYVPSQMIVYEQEYSARLSDSLENLASAIFTLIEEDRNGSSLITTFNLESENVPFFTSPTYGLLNFSSNGQREGKISLTLDGSGSNLPHKFTVGGAASVVSNNRYFIDEMFTFEFSSVFFNRVMTDNTSYLTAGLVSSNSSNWIDLTLVNIIYVPNEISSSSTVPIMVTFINETIQPFKGISIIAFNYDTSLYGQSFYQSVSDSLNNSGLTNNFPVSKLDYQNGAWQFTISSTSSNCVVTNASIEISLV